MAPRRCPICRSKQWHKEPSSGLIACSEGHVLESYRNEAADADVGPHTLVKRTLKSGKKNKARVGKANEKLFHGERARYIYFQCQQLILRHQVVALIKLWDLPPEFETVCRDIWALHLSLMPQPPPAEAHFDLQESAPTKGPDDANAKTWRAERGVQSDGESEQSDSSGSSASDEEDEEDLELNELMRENSESSSSSEDGGVDRTTKVPLAPPRMQSAKKQFSRYASLSSTIAVLMLACWTIRMPVIYMDFIRIIDSYDLPYLDPVRMLPRSMTEHLNKHTISALSPAHAPDTLSLHALTNRLAKRVSTYGIFTPDFNAAPVLWRAVRCLGGMPTLYWLTKQLARILTLTLTLPRANLNRFGKHGLDRHIYDNAPPEVTLIAAVIISLKLVYGLDGTCRFPRRPDEPACAFPPLEEYLSLLKKLDTEDSRARFHSRAVADLEEEALDEYLDFCEKALLSPKGDEKNGGLLDRQFPLSTGTMRKERRATKAGCDPGRLVRIAPVDEGLRPGERYVIYNSRDVGGSLPEEYEAIIGRAAIWVGVRDQYLCGVVEQFERRIVRWQEDQKVEKEAVSEAEESEAV